MPPELEALQARLGYRFDDHAILVHALTHRSWCSEHEGDPSNERLEFLGDAVLGMVITDEAFRRFPELPEGQLAKTRAAVVSAPTLAHVGAAISLGDGLRLGKGEETSGGRSKPSILADAVEAVIGAVYLDGGMESAQRVILAHFGELMVDAADTPGQRDYKSRLQVLVAARGSEPPVYSVTDSGPEHAKDFHATVMIDGADMGSGDGTSKKEAEQVAAHKAWVTLTTAVPSKGSNVRAS